MLTKPYSPRILLSLLGGSVLLIAVLFLSMKPDTINTGPDASIEDKVEALLKKMTIEEKVGQMTQYNGFWDATGPAPTDGDSKWKYDHLKAGKVGSVLNVSGVENVRAMQKLVVEESRLGIPLIFALDVIHGHKTVAPIPLAESASWDMEAIEKSAAMAANEAASRGINWTFAPMVDISRDARWGRVMEGGGEDPFLGSAIGRARIRGFQGKDLSDPFTLAATAKHFAAYGFAEAGRDYNAADVGTVTLHNVILPPFKAAVEEGVASFMNAFNTLNGIPATGDEYLQRDLLKGEWGYEGFIVSDWGSGSEMVAHGFAKDLEHAAEISANAGSDMDMESYAYAKHLAKLVEEGRVQEKVLDEAVRRILRVKFALGLFDDPYRYCNDKREKERIYHPDHRADALDMAKKSIVLLKNEGNVLPIAKEQKNIVVIGALAEEKNSPLGSWRFGSDDNSAVSFNEGLKTYTDQFKYVKGPDAFLGETSFFNHVKVNESDRSGFDEAVSAAKSADLVILVAGEHGYQSGEGRSRTDIGLPGLQQELLEAVQAANEKVVLVLMNGRPLALPWAAENVPAIVETWQLGTETGNAIAQVLFGDYNPSGHLPMTFPRSVGQVPIYYNQLRTGRPGPLDVVFWSHYTDETNDPLYPFGYGLSYTQFKYSDLKVKKGDAGVNVSLSVTNSGKLDGEDVVQLYIHDKVATVARPMKELKGFEKINLKAGASKEVSFTLSEKELGFYNPQGKFIIEKGEFDVMVGQHANDKEGLTASFEW